MAVFHFPLSVSPPSLSPRVPPNPLLFFSIFLCLHQNLPHFCISNRIVPSDSRAKWKKRKRESNPGSSHKKKQPPVPKQEEEDEEDEDEEAAAEEDEDQDLAAAPNPNVDPVVDLRESEVLLDGGHRVSNFPAVVRHAVNRPHPSVLAIVSAERAAAATGGIGAARPRPPPVFLENISHGQLQVLSAVLPDNPSLNASPEADKPTVYVCTPPALMEGKGVVKQFGNGRPLVVPVHSDWFHPSTVHRLERQVVPHYFSGKSSEHTPERYIALRNRIVAKYLENPRKRLSFADCQGLVPGSGGELYDLSRIVRFLDHWGVINYLAVAGHWGHKLGDSILQEEASGELHVHTAALRSIDSLVQFERPRSSYRLEDISALCSSVGSAGASSEVPDLDSRIRERLSEYTCSYCSCHLPQMHYQSQKEADIILCSGCFHDGQFITGHSSVDFLRVESTKDLCDLDGDSWTDQETLLLLEALEVYNDNWNEIAEHVGTKSKAQCIMHFIRLPMEDGLLENIELPCTAVPSDPSNDLNNEMNSSNGVSLPELSSSNRLPFANSGNPLMSLVAFLAAAVGPRVAAACASVSLSVLTKEETKTDRAHSANARTDDGSHAEYMNTGHPKEDTLEGQGVQVIKDRSSASPLDQVKSAAISGLSAAAMKAKLFADHEEREIQRFVTTILHHQLKRLELKLKQFAEVETLLMKECEQVERARQRLLAERVRISSTRFGQAGAATPDATVAAASNSNIRPPVIPSSIGLTNIPSGYSNNLPSNPHMPFVQRQPMFPFGPRLPVSAIHPSSSTPSAMPSSGMANAPSNHRPLLRPMSGNNTNLG